MRTKRLWLRHLVPLVAILAIPAGTHATASATPARPSPVSALASREMAQLTHSSTAQLTSALRRLRSVHLSTVPGVASMSRRAGELPPAVHAAVGHISSNASATDLGIPSDVLASGNGTQALVGSGQGPFKVFHSSWNGYSSGIAASFNFEPIMDLFYQGSVFTSASFAQAYMTDSYNHLTNGNSVAPIDCSSSVGYPCQIIGYVTTTGLIAVYNVARINYCVIETGYQGDPNQVQANSDTVAKVTADTFLLGVGEAEAACTTSGSPSPQPTASPTTVPTVQPTSKPTTQPTQVSTNIDVQGCFQKNGTQPSANHTCLHSIKHGKKVELEVYTTVQSAPVGSSATVSATIKRGSTQVKSESGTFTTESGSNVYAVGDTWTVPKKKGTYTLNVQTTMNGVSASDTEKLKVT